MARLLLYRLPVDLAPALQDALQRLWAGELLLSDQPGDLEPALCVVAAATAEAAEAAVEPLHAAWPHAPVLAQVGEGARRLRGRPGAIVWAFQPSEADPTTLGLALRYALEVGQRRRLQDSVQALRPLADLGGVAAATSHEIGNPLTGLLTNLELARAHLAQVRSGRASDLELLGSLVADALDGARHVSRVAQDLSRASRPVGRVSTVDPWAVVDTARRLAAADLQGIAVEHQVRRPALARLDERRATQVFVNLFRNAAQALVGTARPTVRITFDLQGDQVIVRFADNGPGLPPAIAERLFEPWMTTKASGSGLGLALARKYLADMGGSIASVADPGSPGAAFELRFAMAAGEKRPTLVPDQSDTHARVLVVDDLALVRRAIVRALSGKYLVDQAADGATALLLAAEHTYDVVLLDMNLEETTGIKLWEKLQATHPGRCRKVVFLSGTFTSAELAWLEQRSLRWVRKPLGAEEVRDLVLELVGSGT